MTIFFCVHGFCHSCADLWLGNGQAQLERSATLKAKNRKPVAQRGADLSSRPVASNLRIKALVYCQGPRGWVGH
jgi:hypothetical protein